MAAANSRPRWLLVGSALASAVGILASVVGFGVLIWIEASLVTGSIDVDSRGLIRLRILNDYPWIFRTAWSLRFLTMMCIGLHLASWAKVLKDERPFLTQATAYFLGIALTLESLSWTFTYYGLPELAAWYWQTVPGDQAIPFREFGIWSGIQSLLSSFLSTCLLCGAGFLLSLGSLSSKVSNKFLGFWGLPLFGVGLALGIASRLLPEDSYRIASGLTAIAGLGYAAAATWIWVRPQKN